MDNEKRVLYAITREGYSDYCICAITSDKERAEFLRRYYTFSGEEAQIEEYIDSDPDVGQTRQLFPVWKVTRTVMNEWAAYLTIYEEKPYKNTYSFIDSAYVVKKNTVIFSAKIQADDESHAIKIAQDQYAKMMAEKLGV